MDATNEQSFQRLCQDLRDNRPRSSVSLLNASKNHLRRLGDSLRGNTGLRCLTLRGGTIFRDEADDVALASLYDFIEQAPAFSTLELDSECDDYQDVCPTIPSLLLKAFGRSSLEGFEGKTLTLSRLRLSDLIGGLSMLMHQGSLETLSLGRLHDIDESEVELVSRSFQTKKSGLDSLRLTEKLPLRTCFALVEGLSGNPSLNSVVLDACCEKNAYFLAKLLGNCPSLQFLSLSGVQFTSAGLDGLAGLADGIRAASALSLVDLSKCALTPDHASSLSSFLGQLKNMRTLILDSNQLGNIGFEHVCRALHGHGSITELSFAENRIAGDVTETLRGLFRKNHSIASISLEKNDFSACKRSAWEAMVENEALSDVWLQDCFVSMTCWLDIYRAYASGQNKMELDWSIGTNEGRTSRTSLIMCASTSRNDSDKTCSLQFRCNSSSAERLAWLLTALHSEPHLNKLTMTTGLVYEGTTDLMHAVASCESLQELQIVRTTGPCVAVREGIESLCLVLPKCRFLRRLVLMGFWRDETFKGELLRRIEGALEKNRSLLWIQMQGIIEADWLPFEYILLRNRILSLSDTPVALIPKALRHPRICQRTLPAHCFKSLNVDFVAMKAYWERFSCQLS